MVDENSKISQNGWLLQVSVVINDSELLAHVIAAMSIKAWWKLVWSSRVSGGAAFSIPLRLRGWPRYEILVAGLLAIMHCFQYCAISAIECKKSFQRQPTCIVSERRVIDRGAWMLRIVWTVFRQLFHFQIPKENVLMGGRRRSTASHVWILAGVSGMLATVWYTILYIQCK